MKQYIELLSMSDEYSIGNNNNLKEIIVTGDVDISGNVNIKGKATFTINDVSNQTTTLLELNTQSNSSLIKHDFLQHSIGHGDYQIYSASEGITDFNIGGLNKSFQTVSLNASDEVKINSNLTVDGVLDMSNNIIMNNNRIIFSASDNSIIPPDSGIIQKVQDLENKINLIFTILDKLEGN